MQSLVNLISVRVKKYCHDLFKDNCDNNQIDQSPSSGHGGVEKGVQPVEQFIQSELTLLLSASDDQCLASWGCQMSWPFEVIIVLEDRIISGTPVLEDAIFMDPPGAVPTISAHASCLHIET